MYHRRRRTNSSVSKAQRSDCLRLFPADAATSDEGSKPSAASSELLYLGTRVNSREGGDNAAADSANVGTSSAMAYQKLDSPELHPLPPLPRQNYRSGEVHLSEEGEEEEEFYSPRESSGDRDSPDDNNGMSSPTVLLHTDNLMSSNSISRSPSDRYSNSLSPVSSSVSKSSSPLLNVNTKLSDLKPASSSPPHSPPQIEGSLESESGNSPTTTSKSPATTSVNGFGQIFAVVKQPPPPPPLPPPRFWEIPLRGGPPVLAPPLSSTTAEQKQSHDSEAVERDEKTPKPKLKPLHWDKVRASSDRAMVWDQLKSSSFQLNEEMIETLFMVNSSSNLIPKDSTRCPVLPLLNQENRVLDPKKSQNIAILLRALNVTIEEVCEALLEGNSDTLGTELLESLLKMAPTKEEERKLKEFKDESPFKLGPAERFLRAVLDIPFAFKRVDAMLYIANFDAEIEYLKQSFETLEAACHELRNSKMFLKLLEAVLKTGNRMNVGTNRGDAEAFKLDTLLKLVDIKGADGKTTLLHFVVQEIIRIEGSRLSGTIHNPISEQHQQSSLRVEVENKKLGLQVVSSLSSELTNVKKAAAMDSDVLTNEVERLSSGITKVQEVVKLNEESFAATAKESGVKFSESTNGFLKKAEEETLLIRAQKTAAFCLVKEITEYFHGNSAKEEAHRFRIFMVVRDFLSILDSVCKEVGKINERTIVSSSRQYPTAVNPITQTLVFPGFISVRRQCGYSTSDDEDSSLS